MAAIARFQFLQPYPFSKPSAIFTKFLQSSPSFSNFNSIKRCRIHFRKFSVTSPLCSSSSSSSDSIPECPESFESSTSIVGDLLDYLNESWTQFHATAEAKRQLIAAGFHLLKENEKWDLQPGGRYFFTRNMSSLVAFAIGKKYSIGNGFHVIAAHTDSPCLKLKPKSASTKSGYLMVNVQTYGGGLWHTWFDRDLSVAGRVILRADDGSFLHRLVKITRPLLRVPTLAIHLNRTVNQDGFKPNLETHLIPLLATKTENATTDSTEKSKVSSSKDVHHQLLLKILSDELSCKIDDIVSVELNICDTQPSCLGGANNEFIFSGRLDNLASSFCGLRALIDSCALPEDLSNENSIRMIALFDNEEDFVVRNDMGCGSTIGPILASGVGIRTVDCGIAQLSMHSVREVCGKEDVDSAYEHFKAFYQSFSSIDRKLSVD
ncbi:probable aspartyl aminopeptidase isoform X3 [Solanum dulcamara]|uniref:probable aspartyl aminopeptidase isoform X3 n=1 Tax=Solanum dulcamara TaxID=45834 RepID=UPI002486712D|nr:probable aspartyl aminopeptidase isoform X3 [Solanum dulcamara]